MDLISFSVPKFPLLLCMPWACTWLLSLIHKRMIYSYWDNHSPIKNIYIMVIRSQRESFLSSSAAKETGEVEEDGQTHAKCVQGLISFLDTCMQNTVSGVRPTLSSASVFLLCFKCHFVALDIVHTLKVLTGSEFLAWSVVMWGLYSEAAVETSQMRDERKALEGGTAEVLIHPVLKHLSDYGSVRAGRPSRVCIWYSKEGLTQSREMVAVYWIYCTYDFL